MIINVCMCLYIFIFVPIEGWINLDLVDLHTSDTFLEIETANQKLYINNFIVEKRSHENCKLLAVEKIKKVTFAKVPICSVITDLYFYCYLNFRGINYSLILEFYYLCPQDTVSIRFENLEEFVKKTDSPFVLYFKSFDGSRFSKFSNPKHSFLPSIHLTSTSFDQLYCSKLSFTKNRVKLIISSKPINITREGNLICSKLLHSQGKLSRFRRVAPNRPPILNSKMFITNILEEQPPGLVLNVNISSTDSDGSAGKMTYSLFAAKDQRSQMMFEINPITGKVTTMQKLDRESMPVHHFRVVVQDSGKPKMNAEASLTIYVKDVNDHQPKFESNTYTKTVSENLVSGSEVLTVHAIDEDSDENGEISYSILNAEEVRDVFEIDPQHGVITTISRLDRETKDFFQFKILAVDNAQLEPKFSSTAIIEINVQDENDNRPQFVNSSYYFDVEENMDYLVTPSIGDIRATDTDLGSNGLVRYSITSGNSLGHFIIDPNDGTLSLIGPLDYEKIKSYKLFVKAQDHGNPPKSNTTSVIINVLDSNDNEPKFDVPYYHESIPENLPVSSNVLKVRAYDSDSGLYGTVRYFIKSKDNVPFSINEHGNIVTSENIDREIQSVFKFELIACDSGGAFERCSETVVEMTIRDVNDNSPIFEQKIYNSTISEDATPGSLVETVRATDADEDMNGRITYKIVSGNERGSFGLVTQIGYGTLSVSRILNYKQQNRYMLVISASDGTFEDTATIYVSVQDVNLNRPFFLNTPYHFKLLEDASTGQIVFNVSAFDADSGENARISYSLSSNEAFSVNEITGEVTLVNSLDRETKAGYSLTVTALDHGHPPKLDFADIEVLIIDANDNQPTFLMSSYQASISEDALIGTNVLMVLAKDLDEGQNKRIRYVLDERVEDFKIDSTLGIIRTAKELDREKVSNYDLLVYAVDGGEVSLTGSVLVNVEVLDVNDNAPVFDSSNLVFYVQENVPIGTRIGEIQVYDLDEGSNALVEFSILPGLDSESFNMAAFDDKTFLMSMVEFDFESAKKEFAVVTRARSNHLFTDALIKVVVMDVNDNIPILNDFVILFNNYKDHFNLGYIGKVPAYDPDLNDALRYKFVYGNQGLLLHMNETTGIMRLDSRLNSDVPTNGTLVVSVTDGINEVRATCKLYVRLVTEEMLSNSITIQIENVDAKSFLGDPYILLTSALAALVPCTQDDVFIIDIQSDLSSSVIEVLNVSFAIHHPSSQKTDDYFSQEFLKEKVHLLRSLLMKLSILNILSFEDDLCLHEPCLNFEECNSILRFDGSSNVISSDTMFFRPIRSTTIFTCRCPPGFTGMNYQFLCDVEVNLCFSNPCNNNGTCLQREGGYYCSCNPSFTGVHCEIELHSMEVCSWNVCKQPSTCISLKGGGVKCETCEGGGRCLDCKDQLGNNEFCEGVVRSFRSGSFLMFPSIQRRHRFNITFRFATRMTDGLLLYNGRFNGHHDFILLEIRNKQLHFSFSLGSQVTMVTTFVRGGINTGQWIEASVSYFNGTVTLVAGEECDVALSSKFTENYCARQAIQQLEERCKDVTEMCHRLLDLTGPLLIGGMPSSAANHDPPMISFPNFIGCIGNFSIDGKFIDLNSFISENVTTLGCIQKKNFCISNPCLNGGKCSTVWGGFKCECSDGFTNKNCKVPVPPSDHSTRLTGNSSITFPPNLHGLPPIRHPWFISFHLKTTQSRSTFMHLQLSDAARVVDLLILLKDGKIECVFPDLTRYLMDEIVNDGLWHHLQVVLSNNQLHFHLNFGLTQVSYPIEKNMAGYHVGRIVFGGRMESELLDGFRGCVKSIRVGNNNGVVLVDRLESNIEKGCTSNNACTSKAHNCSTNSSECISVFDSFTCQCDLGFVGPDCSRNVCDVYEPCSSKNMKCILSLESSQGYKCICDGEHCGSSEVMKCPASWWGEPVCGPCSCPIGRGFSPNCDKKTGNCFCKLNHYLRGSECLPCDCYDIGSLSLTCDVLSGQCPCRNNVIGRQCDACTSKMAQVTLQGCEVVYTGCPKSFHKNVWWDKTPWNIILTTNCPNKMIGMTTRYCNESHGWEEPDMRNCSLLIFRDLKLLLEALETDDLEVNTFVSKDILSRLKRATNISKNQMTARDINVTKNLLDKILSYESKQVGLNMVHSQDRNFISNLVDVVGCVTDDKYSEEWKVIHLKQPKASTFLIENIFKYLEAITLNMQILFTQPFDATHKNFLLGLDWIDGNHPGSHIKLPKFNNKLKHQMVLDFQTSINFPRISPANENNQTSKILIYYGYIISRHLGVIMPPHYDDRLKRQITSLSVIESHVFHLHMINATNMTPLKPEPIVSVEFKNILKTKQSNPRCVMLSDKTWTLKGCKLADGDVTVCLCSNISTYAVITEALKQLNMEPFLLDAACYAILIISIILLLCSFLIFFFINTMPTTANIIHLNLSANMLLSFFIFLLSIDRVHNKELCRITAIFLHLFLMSSHWWMFGGLFHLYRRLTDVRDVNHGNMQLYYIIGYVIPGIIVSLAVGLNTDAYGNRYFCWIPQGNTLTWSFIVPMVGCIIFSVVSLLVSLFSIIGGRSKHADGDLRYFKYGLQAGCIMLVLMSLSSLFLALSLNNVRILPYKYLFLVSCLFQSIFLVVAYIIFSNETQRQLHYVWYKTMSHQNADDVQKFAKRPKSLSFQSEGSRGFKASEHNSNLSVKSNERKTQNVSCPSPQNQQIINSQENLREHVVELHDRPTIDSEESEISALERRIEDFTSSDDDEPWIALNLDPGISSRSKVISRNKKPQLDYIDSTSSGSELIR